MILECGSSGGCCHRHLEVSLPVVHASVIVQDKKIDVAASIIIFLFVPETKQPEPDYVLSMTRRKFVRYQTSRVSLCLWSSVACG